jgi:hypothetical protein
MGNPDPWQLNRWELRRLILHIERALVAQTPLKTLMSAAGKTVADHRRALRDIRGRIKRRVSKARRGATHPTHRSLPTGTRAESRRRSGSHSKARQ